LKQKKKKRRGKRKEKKLAAIVVNITTARFIPDLKDPQDSLRA